MSERTTKTQRWLDLIAFLVGRRVPVEVDAIMTAVPAYTQRWVEGDETARQSARRMFERDKDELREFGIPLESVRYRIGYGREEVTGYRLQGRDFYLPYLRLVSGPEAGPGQPRPATGVSFRQATVDIRPEEAGAAWAALARVAELPSFPLRREARSALRKLSFDLDPVVAVDRASPVLYADRPGADDVRRRVRALSDALLARKRVRFTYHGIERGRATDRDVAPYGLLFHHGHWYLVGHDATRQDIRVFRVGRMDEPTVNPSAPRTADYEIPEEFSLDVYRDREAWELGSTDDEWITARVRFEFPRSLWAERNGHGTLVEDRDDGSSVREFRVLQVSPFLRWILSLEGDAEVLEPVELRHGLVRLVREVLAVYEAGGSDD